MKTSTLLAITMMLSPTLATSQQQGQATIVAVTPVTVTPVRVTPIQVNPATISPEKAEGNTGKPATPPPAKEPAREFPQPLLNQAAVPVPQVEPATVPPKAKVVPEETSMPEKTTEAKDAKAPAASTEGSVRLHFDLDKQTFTWTGNGITKTGPIASGKIGTETPTGANLKVVQKFGKDHVSTQFPGAKMPYMLQIGGTDDQGRDVTSRGIGSHGVPIGFGLKNEDGGQYPASHGCIRMSTANAEWLFVHTPKGTPVKITGSAKTYLATNRVMPWQRSGAENALKQLSNGEWAFIKPMTKEGAAFLVAELQAGRLGLCKLPKVVPDQCPVNFPDIPELGDPKKQTLAERQSRYFTGTELKQGLATLANFHVKRYVRP